jgi:hypothetical protein
MISIFLFFIYFIQFFELKSAAVPVLVPQKEVIIEKVKHLLPSVNNNLNFLNYIAQSPGISTDSLLHFLKKHYGEQHRINIDLQGINYSAALEHLMQTLLKLFSLDFKLGRKGNIYSISEEVEMTTESPEDALDALPYKIELLETAAFGSQYALQGIIKELNTQLKENQISILFTYGYNPGSAMGLYSLEPVTHVSVVTKFEGKIYHVSMLSEFIPDSHESELGVHLLKNWESIYKSLLNPNLQDDSNILKVSDLKYSNILLRYAVIGLNKYL